MTDPFNLAFVTEGKIDQIIGIEWLVHELTFQISKRGWLPRVWLVAPVNLKSYVLNHVTEACGDIQLEFIGAECRTDDKYYIQMGLSSCFTETPAGELLLCLDYDHVIVDADKLELQHPTSKISVSSEIGPWTYSAQHATRSNGRSVPTRHLNVSLIYGYRGDLVQAGSQWQKCYEDLRPFVEQRNRVELAFSLACDRANLSVAPCNSQLQSNFAVGTLACCLFHFGGDSVGARSLKTHLEAISQQYKERPPTPRELERIHQALTNQLRTFIK